MTTLRLEEESPVVSPNGWHATVRINQIGVSPGGSERVLRSASYRFKQGAPNETDEQRGLRLGVTRNAKKRAMDKFDSEKVAQTRTKRRKSGAAAAGLASAWCRRVPSCCAGHTTLMGRVAATFRITGAPRAARHRDGARPDDSPRYEVAGERG